MRRGTTLTALLIALAAGGEAWAVWPGLTLVPAHQVRAPAAVLDAATLADVDAATPGAGADADALVRAMLRVTGRRLHFGLDHRTSMAFAADEREGNCVEYAHLFAAGFNRMASRRGVAARAWVVRSQARLFGGRVPMRAWGDHDWVLVALADGRRLHVDPSFDDTGLGHDVTANVRGTVNPPRR